MPEMKLEVDGRDVPLNQFVRTFIENTILCMVTSLSGVGPEPKRIVLSIESTAAGPAAVRETKEHAGEETAKRKPKRKA